MGAHYPTLTIEADGPTLHRATVKLDEFEVPALTGISLDMKVNEANHVTLELLVEDVKVDAETLAALKAEVAKKGEQ